MLEFLNTVQVRLVNPNREGKKKVYEFIADTSDRKTHNIGTSDIPARVQISSNLNSTNLVIKCKMLTDPLL